MKQFVVAMLLVAGLTLVGCGSSSSGNPANINGTWNATLLDSNNATFFTFGTSLLVKGDGTLNVTNLTITAPSPCFASAATESGSFTLGGNLNGKVTGTFGFTVLSGNPAGNTLMLSGMANGNTISGTWTLSGVGCAGTGSFSMVKV